ncbi:MAG: oligosaccharide flippase family protein [Chloroflexota bacterium]
MSGTQKYFFGLISGYAVTFVTTLVGLWLTPFTLRFLTREEYAIFALASDMLMWLSLLDIGISSGLNVQAAQLTGRPNAEKLNRLASTAFFTQNIVSLVILLVGAGGAFAFPFFFEIKPELAQQAIWVSLLLVVGVAVNMFMQIFSSLLVANQQMYLDNIIRLLLLVIRTGLTVLFLLLGWKVISLAIAQLTGVIITAFLAGMRVRKLLPKLQIHRKWFTWDLLKDTGSLGIWFSLGGLAGIVITSLDRIVAAKLISVELVTTLTLTGRLYVLFGGLIQQLTNNARPMLGKLFGSGKFDEAYLRYHQIFVISTGISVIVASGLLAFNGVFITWWVGASNYGGLWLDVALALNVIIHAWVLPNRAILSANLTVRPQTLSRLLEGFLNVAISILLARWIGVVGIVISTAIAGTLTSNWYLPFLTSRMFGRPYSSFIRNDAFRLASFTVFMFLITILARLQFGENINMIENILLSSAVGSVGVLIFWFVVLEADMRGELAAQLQKAGQFIRQLRWTPR